MISTQTLQNALVLTKAVKRHITKAQIPSYGELRQIIEGEAFERVLNDIVQKYNHSILITAFSFIRQDIPEEVVQMHTWVSLNSHVLR